MDKIKNFIAKYPVIDVVVLAIVVTVFCFLYSNHLLMFVVDKGRELLIPEEILNGNVPYKDITLIYFPTAYYINALIYRFLGVSMNSLIISQGILSVAYVSLYYFLSRIFLGRKSSFLLSLLMISCSVFSYHDLFAFISPYSYARAYGIASFTLCTFLLLKMFKTDNLVYLYLAALTAGFCFICKFEFFIAYILLAAALFMYKKLSVFQYVKVFLTSLIFPLILLAVLFMQGVSVNEMLAAADFGYKFSKTAAMTRFLSESGMYPFKIMSKMKFAAGAMPFLITIILLCFTALKLNMKYAKFWIIPAMTVFIWRFYCIKDSIAYYWVLLPIFIFIVLCFKYKEFWNENKKFLFLIIAALLISQRTFFHLTLCAYGMFAFPLLILCLYIITQKYIPSLVFGVDRDKLMNYVVVILIGMYLINLQVKYQDTYLPISSEKGTIYTDVNDYDLISKTITYLEKNTDENATVLVLPEGHIINFFTGRKTNLKCHMMDRLYYEAYGAENARDMIASTKSDYIIIIKGLRLSDFYHEYLYEKGKSLPRKYIDEHYKRVKLFTNGLGAVQIFKKIS